jgi:hypothetical protein
MKNSIKLAAALLVVSASIFSVSAKAVVPFTGDVVTFSSLPSLAGLNIKVDKNVAGKAIVIIYNQNKDVIFKDALAADKSSQKGYVLNQLESGDYTIEVFSGNKTVKKDIHVYEADGQKSFLVKE